MESITQDNILDDIDNILNDIIIESENEEDTTSSLVLEEPKVEVTTTKKTKVLNVSNKELLEELAISRSKGHMTERLGELFMKLAKHYLNRYEWRNYTYKDEFYSLCLVYMCSCWEKFDPEKSSQAFSYFTQVCYSACLRHLAYEKKISKSKDTLYKDFNQRNQTGFINHYDTDQIDRNPDNTNITESIGPYDINEDDDNGDDVNE